jgi:hypothetical protein
VLTTLLVPQGMAYAELAGLPPITGLYTSIVCLLSYAVFGPSRILVLGPDSSLGPMIAATILPLIAAGGDEKRAVALASMLAIMVAAIMILATVARLGFIADLISKPTMIGYMNGLALTILAGQLPKLFGFNVEANGFAGELTGFAKGLANGEAVAAAAAAGIAGIVLILVLQRWFSKLPAVLIMVVLSIAATSVFDLAGRTDRVGGPPLRGFADLDGCDDRQGHGGADLPLPDVERRRRDVLVARHLPGQGGYPQGAGAGRTGMFHRGGPRHRAWDAGAGRSAVWERQVMLTVQGVPVREDAVTILEFDDAGLIGSSAPITTSSA